MQNLPTGIYQLKYVYSVAFSVSLSMSQVYAYLNTTLIDSRTAPTYSWNTATIRNVTISTANSSHYLKFCGNNDLKNYGVVISSVSFSKIAEIPVTTVIPNNTTTGTTAPTNNTNTNTTSQTNLTNESSQSNTTTPAN